MLWGLFFPMGFSCSSKCRRVLPFPVASSKVRSRTSFFSLGITACAFLAAFLLAFLVRAPSICSKTRSAAAVSCSRSAPGAWGSGGASVVGAGAVPPGRGCAACSGCCGSASFLVRSASLMRLLIRFFLPVAAFTSTAPSRVIFCVTFSRALYCFICLSLQSAPLQGRNTRHLSQCLYNACEAASRLPPSCRCRKRGQAQCRLSDSPP